MLVVDGQYGLHPSDEEVLTWLRQHHPSKPVVLAVNKCESQIKGATQVCCLLGVDARLGFQGHGLQAFCGDRATGAQFVQAFVVTGAQGHRVCAGITAVATHTWV